MGGGKHGSESVKGYKNRRRNIKINSDKGGKRKGTTNLSNKREKSLMDIPTEDEAMAEPHPKVLKQESTIFPVSGSTLIWSFMTSPQAGAPTRPVPTLGSFLSKDPTLRGLL